MPAFAGAGAGTASAAMHHRPRAISRPRIHGRAQVGRTLHASPGRWIGARSLRFTWKRCNGHGRRCVTIRLKRRRRHPRAYRLTRRDAGHTVRVTVTAANAWGRRSATSRATRVVRKAAGRPAPPPPGPPGTGPPGTGPPGTGPPGAGLHVSGNRLLNAAGNPVSLHGVNRSGTEYSCIQGNGIFDGPSDAASVAAMAAWHINIVRVPLNEDCWLGINGVKAQYAGANYINAIVNYVNLLHQNGMYAELSLIWAAPGSAPATYQSNAPDEDHSPAMWASLAATFKNDPNVILAPWGETTVDWGCFMHGCDNQATYGSNQDGDPSCGGGCWYYNSAGMQQAVDVMRQAGYAGPIAIPCISYANICADPSNGGTGWGGGNWLTDHPVDPDHQLLAEAHVYGKNTCDTTACFNTTMLPILQAGYPLIWGETGETYDFSDCPSTSYIQTFLAWAEQHGVGTEAWTWDTWGNCSSGALISDYNGTPEGAYGAYVRSNYQSTYPANGAGL